MFYKKGLQCPHNVLKKEVLVRFFAICFTRCPQGFYKAYNAFATHSAAASMQTESAPREARAPDLEVNSLTL